MDWWMTENNARAKWDATAVALFDGTFLPFDRHGGGLIIACVSLSLFSVFFWTAGEFQWVTMIGSISA